MTHVSVPVSYRPKLDVYQTQMAIEVIKTSFQHVLCNTLSLKRVSAPLFVRESSGLNDNLNGTERPVAFDIPAVGTEAQVVHSLAKWKRLALKRYHFLPGEGLVTDMNAIRRDEDTLDNLHSVYVDQWDWEKIITPEQRNLQYLKETVRGIVSAVCRTNEALRVKFPQLNADICEKVSFITTQELEDMYPDLTPSERENIYLREHKTAFIMQIGAPLRSGKPHDGRAPDYDDWSLNGDIMIWYAPMECALELSSMGIRVNAESLRSQLEISGHEERAALPFHRALLDGELPLTVGGGIGQSRLCMALLAKVHVGEVQCSVWPEDMVKACADAGIALL